MFRYIGIGLLGLFVVLIIPAQIEPISNDLEFSGYLTLAQYDENGNNVFTQTLHNQFVDTGETFLLQQVFQEGNADADNVQIGVICLTDAAPIIISETETATDFDGDNSIPPFTNCDEDANVAISSGTAQIGPITFSAGTHVANSTTITGVGICQSNTGATPFTDCATTGILFAVVDSADITLGVSDTLDVTYTFDISSPSS